MTFDEVRDKTVADLREVARLLGVEADEIAKGDLGRMDRLLDKLPAWFDMLLVRHDHRMGELEESRLPGQAASSAPQPSN